MYCLKNRKALSRDQNINFLRNSGYTATAAVSLDPLQCHVQTWPQTVPQAIVALRAHYVGTACSAHVMKPSQGGREETHLCRRHEVLHILVGWWLWPSTICYCVSVLEDGGSLLGNRHSALTQLGPNL